MWQKTPCCSLAFHSRSHSWVLPWHQVQSLPAIGFCKLWATVSMLQKLKRQPRSLQFYLQIGLVVITTFWAAESLWRLPYVVSHQILLFFPVLSRKRNISVLQWKISFWNSLSDQKHLRQKYHMLPEKCKHKSCCKEATERPTGTCSSLDKHSCGIWLEFSPDTQDARSCVAPEPTFQCTTALLFQDQP